MRLRKSAVESNASLPERSRPRIHMTKLPRTAAPMTRSTTINATLLSAARIPITNTTRPRADRMAPIVSNAPRRVRWHRVVDPAGEEDNAQDDEGLKDKRSAPADGGRDEAADQGSSGRTYPPHATDHPERPGARSEVGEEHRGEDVDRRDQQGGAHSFEDRIPENENSQSRRDGTEDSPDGVDPEPQREAPFPSPTVGQLAAGNHEGGHHQEEQRDGYLDTLDCGVQVVTYIGDHDIHVRAGKTADELRQCQRHEHFPERWRRSRLGGPIHRVSRGEC